MNLYVSGNCSVMADLSVVSGNDLFVLGSLENHERELDSCYSKNAACSPATQFTLLEIKQKLIFRS